jgi:hypothetical protein
VIPPATIARANLDGTGVDRSFITPHPAAYCPFSQEAAPGLAVDGAYVYWSSEWEPRPRDSNRFGFGKVKRNARKGTAKLAVKVPFRGQLSLAETKRVKRVSTLAKAGWARLPIRPRGTAKQRLATRGRVKVKATVTYVAQDSCGDPRTKSRKLTLIKRG